MEVCRRLLLTEHVLDVLSSQHTFVHDLSIGRFKLLNNFLVTWTQSLIPEAHLVPFAATATCTDSLTTSIQSRFPASKTLLFGIGRFSLAAFDCV
jgi:hypothetical protein